MVILLDIYRFFCSLKLAIFTLSALIVLLAIGTFYESARGREAAQELIYDSLSMNILLSLLALNIMAVMLDRLPWKKKHTGFLLAHFGILFIIAGAFITRFYGVDGYIRLKIGEQSQHITQSNTFLNVYASFDGMNLKPIYREKVFFFRSSPKPHKPYTVPLGSLILTISDFYPSAIVQESYKPLPEDVQHEFSNKNSVRGGTALRFLIEGSQGPLSRWIFRAPYQEKAELSIGPARIMLFKTLPSPSAKSPVKPVIPTQPVIPAKAGTSSSGPSAGPALLLAPSSKGLEYQLIKAEKILKKGILQKGSTIKTGWMDFQFRVLEYWPKALPVRIFTPTKKASDQSIPAIKVEFQKENRWMGLHSQLFFFDEDKVYIVAYGHEQKKVDFSLKLEKFKIQHYPSSRKAKSYESEVQINQTGGGQTETFNQVHRKNTLISMNKPLKWGAYTIYQSGFEENEQGEPIASIFSVNKDPGRWIKYFGSLLVVLGITLLFIRRNLKKKLKKETEKIELSKK